MATSSSSSSAARTTVIVHPVNERITTMIAAGMCVQGSIEGAEGVYVRGEITGDLLINDDGPPDTGTVVVDKTGIVHVPVGKASFPVANLIDNASTLLESVVKAKPSAAKGKYLRSITISSTMGPGIRIDELRIESAAKQ